MHRFKRTQLVLDEPAVGAAPYRDRGDFSGKSVRLFWGWFTFLKHFLLSFRTAAANRALKTLANPDKPRVFTYCFGIAVACHRPICAHPSGRKVKPCIENS